MEHPRKPLVTVSTNKDTEDFENARSKIPEKQDSVEYDEWSIGSGESDLIDGDAESMINIDQNVFADPAQTMQMLAPRKPMTITELRAKNPQVAVDYLFQRKEKWKAAAIRLNNRVKDLLVEVQIFKNSFSGLKTEVANSRGAIGKKEQEIKHWKRKHRQEVDMKKWWRNAFAISAGVTAITIVAMMVITIQTAISRPELPQQFVPRIPTSGAVQSTPNRVLSSVLIYNGKKQGSGTVISKGEEYSAVLTAAHNFSGKIGGECWVYYADGTFTRATLISYDKDRDLALLKVASSTIIGNSFVPEKMPGSSSFTCVGYSNGQGPNMNNLMYDSTYKNESNKFMWQVSLNDGAIWDGASGGGVFLGDACIGVTSQRDAVMYVSQNGQYVQSKRMYAVCHQEVLNFLEENKEAIKDCGNWTVEPENQYGGGENSPPLWTPNPNVPVNIPGNNLATLKEDVDQLKKTVFGSLKLPSDVASEAPSDVASEAPSDVPSSVTDETPQDEVKELTEGQKRPNDVPLPNEVPTAPNE